MQNLAFPWIPFLIFAVVNCVTPGPNVVLLTSQGGRWGFKKSIPAIIGVSIGFPLMLLIVQFGAAEVFKLLPWLFPALTLASLIYILILSLKIFRLGFSKEVDSESRAKPISLTSMIFFQWINGKAWQMVIMTATLYATNSLEIKLLSAFSFFVILIITASFWVEVGKRIAGLLKNPKFKKAYYATLAAALILSTFPTGVSQLIETYHSLIFLRQ